MKSYCKRSLPLLTFCQILDLAAKIFQNDLDAVKANLGLPKYDVGQAVVHTYREGIRGVIMEVDLQCSKGRQWVEVSGIAT